MISRFSVEVVNKQFYTEIATCFTKLVGGERDGKKYEKLLNLQSTVDHNKYAEFADKIYDLPKYEGMLQLSDNHTLFVVGFQGGKHKFISTYCIQNINTAQPIDK